MADATLASIISGTDPLAPLELRALQQQQLLNSARDASQWANQGPWGALARTIAGFSGSPAQQTVGNIAGQRIAAQPQTLAALANPGGPLAYAAQHPGMNPISAADILNGPNAGTGQAQALAAIKLRYDRMAQGLDPNTGQPVASAAPGAIPGAPRAAGIVPPPGAGAAFPQGYTGRPTAPTAPNTEATAAPVIQDIQRLSSAGTPQERAQLFAALPPDRQAAIVAHLRQAVPQVPQAQATGPDWAAGNGTTTIP